MEDSVDVPELRAWLALVHAPGVGAGVGRRLTEAGIPAQSLTAGPDHQFDSLGVPRAARQYLRTGRWPEVDADLAWLDAGPDRHLITLADHRYPRLLAQIPDPPLALFVQGQYAVLADPQISIVGSRNPTAGGRDNACAFAGALARAGLTITSGLASGIDAAAHRGALGAGGTTLAVLGTGPDRVYPASHLELARQIARQGALVSEFPPGTGVRPGHFPRRNRLISGLSLGVLVVEATLRSGSLITAKLAAEQGREVFAIPGSIHNPLARGCHQLIREGAKLVEAAQDVLAELGPQLGPLEPVSDAQDPEGTRDRGEGLDDDYRRLLDSLGFDPVPVDVLVARTGLAAQTVASMLLLLELQGHVSSIPGGRYARATRP